MHRRPERAGRAAGSGCRRARRPCPARAASRACRSTTRRAACAARSPGRRASTVPSVASGTRSPTAMLKAPQQICSGWPSPVSTSTSWMRSADGWARSASTSATITPSTGCADDDSISSTARPRRAQGVGQRRPAAPSIGRELAEPGQQHLHQNCSRKRMSLVNISRRSSTPWRDRARRSVPNPKAKPLHSSGSTPTALKHVRVHHAAAAELQPGAVGALQVVLGRRLREREVRGPQPRRVARAEVGLRERLDRAGQVGEGDAAVDDETFDLVEDRHVGGVGRVLAEHPAGHDGVDRRRPGAPSPGSAPARCACAARRCPGAPYSTNSVSHMRAGRMGGRHVQGLEVVPVALDLGTLRDREAEPDEHVLQALVGLGDEVGVAPRRAGRSAR